MAVVTGGACGIGAAFVRRLAAEGRGGSGGGLLACPEASFVTGASYTVDGGYLA